MGRQKYQRRKHPKKPRSKLKSEKAHESEPERTGAEQDQEAENLAWDSLDELNLAHTPSGTEYLPSPDEMEVTRKLSCLNFSIVPCPASSMIFEPVLSLPGDRIGVHTKPEVMVTDVDFGSVGTDLLPTLSDREMGVDAMHCEMRYARKRPSRRKPNKRVKKSRPCITTREAATTHPNEKHLGRSLSPQSSLCVSFVRPTVKDPQFSRTRSFRKPRHLKSRLVDDSLLCFLSDTSAVCDVEGTSRDTMDDMFDCTPPGEQSVSGVRVVEECGGGADNANVDSDLSESTTCDRYDYCVRTPEEISVNVQCRVLSLPTHAHTLTYHHTQVYKHMHPHTLTYTHRHMYYRSLHMHSHSHTTTHKCTNTCTHTLSHTHTGTCIIAPYTCTHTNIQPHTSVQTHAPTHSHAHTQMYIQTHPHTQVYLQTRMCKHAHTHTHSGCEGDDEESSVEGPLSKTDHKLSGWWGKDSLKSSSSDDEKFSQILSGAFPLMSDSGRKQFTDAICPAIPEFKHPGQFGVSTRRGRKKRCKPSQLSNSPTLMEVSQQIIKFVKNGFENELKFNLVSRALCRTISCLANVYNLDCFIEQKRRLPVASPLLRKSLITRLASHREIEPILKNHGRESPSVLFRDNLLATRGAPMDTSSPYIHSSRATRLPHPLEVKMPRPSKLVGGGVPPLNESNVGNQMLQNMGWKPGTGLGLHGNGMREPVKAEVRPKKTGLGY